MIWKLYLANDGALTRVRKFDYSEADGYQSIAIEQWDTKMEREMHSDDPRYRVITTACYVLCAKLDLFKQTRHVRFYKDSRELKVNANQDLLTICEKNGEIMVETLLGYSLTEEEYNEAVAFGECIRELGFL